MERSHNFIHQEKMSVNAWSLALQELTCFFYSIWNKTILLQSKWGKLGRKKKLSFIGEFSLKYCLYLIYFVFIPIVVELDYDKPG